MLTSPLFLRSGLDVLVRVGRSRVDVELRAFPWPRTHSFALDEIEGLHTLRDATSESWRVQARLRSGTDEVVMGHIAEEHEANAVRLTLEAFMRTRG